MTNRTGIATVLCALVGQAAIAASFRDQLFNFLRNQAEIRAAVGALFSLEADRPQVQHLTWAVAKVRDRFFNRASEVCIVPFVAKTAAQRFPGFPRLEWSLAEGNVLR